jgi:dienelactone hydrolase
LYSTSISSTSKPSILDGIIPNSLSTQHQYLTHTMHLQATVLIAACGLTLVPALTLQTGSGDYGTTLTTSNYTDGSRPDPYAASPSPRNLMISVFSPIPKDQCNKATQPYMPPLSASFYNQVYAPLTTNGTFENITLSTCKPLPNPQSPKGKSPRTPVCPPPKFPLLLFSPGSGNTRLIYNALAQAVASHGINVVTIDHPHDALQITYPDETQIHATTFATDADYEAAINVRAADIHGLAAALLDTDTLQHVLPRAAIDATSVFVAGHSLGGATALSVLLADQNARFGGGANFDGRFFTDLLPVGVQTSAPFLLVANQHRNATSDLTWAAVLERNVVEEHVLVRIQGWEHGTFTDLPFLLSSFGVSGYVDGLGDVDGLRVRTVFAGVLVEFLRRVQGNGDLGEKMEKRLGKFEEVEFM